MTEQLPARETSDTPAAENPSESLPFPLRAAATLTAIMLALLIGVRWLNDASLYPPVNWRTELGPQLAASRSDVQEVAIPTADGLDLYGWVLGPDDAEVKIILCAGNAEQIGPAIKMRTLLYKALSAQMLLFDYRGYSRSPGRPSEPGLYRDARAAWDFATGTLGWQPGQIVIWGRSLGAAPAIKLAADLVADSSPRALVVEAGFTSVQAMAELRMPWLGRPAWFTYSSFDSLARAATVDIPVFHFHGRDDRVIPFAMGEELFAAWPGIKRSLWLDSTGHNDIWSEPDRATVILRELRLFLEDTRDKA